MAIDRAEVAALVSPLVSVVVAVVVLVFDVGVAGQEPQQLVNDRLHVQLLGGDERKALAEIEAHLVAEHRDGAGAGAVALLDTIGQGVFLQLDVLSLRSVFCSASCDSALSYDSVSPDSDLAKLPSPSAIASI